MVFLVDFLACVMGRGEQVTDTTSTIPRELSVEAAIRASAPAKSATTNPFTQNGQAERIPKTDALSPSPAICPFTNSRAKLGRVSGMRCNGIRRASRDSPERFKSGALALGYSHASQVLGSGWNRVLTYSLVRMLFA